jgi:N-methylhydantoinase A
MEQPSRVVFSGPAAGTVASAHFGRMISEASLLCADVGGTSCDISMVMNGQPFVNTMFELEHDLVVNTLSNEITSVGAGGGSIVSVSAAGEIKVGPESAGADPGPACYGQGGELPTITDICLLIGVLDGQRFAGGRARLDLSRARAAVAALDTSVDFAQRVRQAYRMGLNNIAEGVFDVVVKNGVDPRDYTMIAYGAAGPMLLPALLDLMRLKRVVIPPHPGLFSALGLVSANQVHADSRSAYIMLGPDAAAQINRLYEDMERAIRERLGPMAGQTEFVRHFDGQLVGQVWDTPFVEVPNGEITPAAIATMITNFHDAYEQRSSNRFDTLPVQGVTYRVNAVVPTNKVKYPELPVRSADDPLRSRGTVTLRYLYDEDTLAEEFDRIDLLAGDRIEGPAVIREALATTHLEKSHVATVGRLGELVITLKTGSSAQ